MSERRLPELGHTGGPSRLPALSVGPLLQTNRQEEKTDPNSRRSSLRPAPGLWGFQRSKNGRKLTVTSGRCGMRRFPGRGGAITGGVSALRQGRPGTGQTAAPDTPCPGTGQTAGPRTEQTPAPALGKYRPRAHPAPSGLGAAPRPSPARPPGAPRPPPRAQPPAQAPLPAPPPREPPGPAPAPLTCW